MGSKITVLWDEGELAPVVVAVRSNVPYRLNAQLGICFESGLRVLRIPRISTRQKNKVLTFSSSKDH